MFNRKELFRRVAIVGVGFMGSSLGLAIKKKGLAREVVGIGRQETSLREAKDLGAIDEGTIDFNKGIIGADLIVLATPVNTILDLIETLGKEHRRGCIITDLGSTKTSIVERAEKVLHHSILFVGSHPLVGSEKKGPANANAQLYEGASCVMTPTDKTNRLAKEKIKQFWTQLGSTVKLMTPQEHDQVLAYISHVPHLAAFALMKAMPDNYLEQATQGLKDTTRIAASDPQVWRDIALSNHKPILKALDEAVKVLASMRKAIVARDPDTLTDIFKQAKEKGNVWIKAMQTEHLVITLDGPAGAGKSTVAKSLAGRLGISYLDTGAMYRALTLKALRLKMDLSDEEALTTLARNTKITFKEMPDGSLNITLDGEDVAAAIRAPEVTNSTHYIAKTPGVRTLMVAWQRAIGQSRSIVTDGRDQGTVVFTDARYKFYVDADVEERVGRRYKELVAAGKPVDLDQLRADMTDRDQKDFNRAVGPLKKAHDAITVDSTGLTVEGTVDKIMKLINL